MAQSKAAVGPASAQVEEPKPTKRMVLQRARVLVVADGVEPEKINEAAKLIGMKGQGEPPTAWLERGIHEGRSKNDSIEAHAGKAGTPDAKPGEYKAVPAASFAGGLRLKVPEKPLVESEAID